MAPFLALLILAAVPLAQEDPKKQDAKPEPEEPDYAFLTGGPYTQGEGLIQFIWASSYGSDASRSQGIRVRDRSLDSSLRVEWGFTDELEADVVAGFSSFSTSEDGVATEAGQGLTDTLFGLRYRFLNEEWAPVTLTFGPQIIAPTGDRKDGLGLGEPGYAMDLTLAKDWGGPFFVYASANYLWTPHVKDPAPSSDRRFTLDTFTYAFALGFRLLERECEAKGVKEDIHLYLEFQGARERRLESSPGGTGRSLAGPLELGLGFRYGITLPEERLLEVGLMFVRGLNEAANDRALLLQLQWEAPLKKKAP
jgi:hypothetical protein